MSATLNSAAGWGEPTGPDDAGAIRGIRLDGGKPGHTTPRDPWLRVELDGDGRSCTLTLVGALCASSIAALDAQVDQLGSVCCDDVVVDLAGLFFIDHVGTNVLVGLQHYVSGRGGRLTIVGAVGQVALLLQAFPDPDQRDVDETGSPMPELT